MLQFAIIAISRRKRGCPGRRFLLVRDPDRPGRRRIVFPGDTATLTLRAEVAPLAGSFCSLHPADRVCELTVVKAMLSLYFYPGFLSSDATLRRLHQLLNTVVDCSAILVASADATFVRNRRAVSSTDCNGAISGQAFRRATRDQVVR
ncbi:hypothetical protein QA635_32685 [Bradyrhizobium brasilense]|uniref:hypothetical protein n=1 Tax=Bradyrhizobium brasilense TaxID=1419277 RepID=UPI0024B06B5C|nr:hypothetical protein [Bradyrhizobium australafricanum]WFU31280.1 hypothetical protein QA635_32685 [Bradyrhizobium australafricanum]